MSADLCLAAAVSRTPHTVWLDGPVPSAMGLGIHGLRYQGSGSVPAASIAGYMLSICLEGGRASALGRLGDVDVSYQLKIGDVFLEVPGPMPGWRWNDPISLIHFYIQPAYLRRVARATLGLEPLGIRRRHGLAVDDSELAALCLALANAASRGMPVNGEGLVRRLLLDHLDLARWDDLARPGFSASEVTVLCSYVETRLFDDLRLDRLAGLVGLGVHHFCRVFRETFEQSPHGYVREHRLERARELLLGTPERVAAIAAATGFADQSHLCRAFKQHFGVAPAEMREGSLERC